MFRFLVLLVFWYYCYCWYLFSFRLKTLWSILMSVIFFLVALLFWYKWCCCWYFIPKHFISVLCHLLDNKFNTAFLESIENKSIQKIKFKRKLPQRQFFWIWYSDHILYSMLSLDEVGNISSGTRSYKSYQKNKPNAFLLMAATWLRQKMFKLYHLSCLVSNPMQDCLTLVIIL